MEDGVTLSELDLSFFTQNSLQDFGTFVAGVFFTILLSKLIQLVFRKYLKRWAAGSKTKLDDILIMALERPLYYICLAVGLQLSVTALVLPDVINRLVTNGATVIVIVFVSWTLTQLIHAFRTVYVDPWTEASESKLDDQVVPIVENTLRATVWIFAVMMVFSNMGYDLMSVITGLGIGGLALAMAAQDTLSNVFGSVTIFADRPFQVDDVVSMAGHTGTVREVGLRTCRLETVEGTVVTVPNSSMVGNVVENLSRRTARRKITTLGLVYDTSSEALEQAMEALREVLRQHPEVRDDFAVRFVNFGDSALEISAIYWVVPPSRYFDVVHEVNLAIKRAFDAGGWDMAFPSQTLYVEGPVTVQHA